MHHGGEILIHHLEIEGCDTVYCVPGESYLAALDGLHDSNRIQTVICRQEGGASMMAEAYGKLSGKPGVCFVTRGPGAANAMSGIHIAYQDSTPMVLFVGMPPREFRDREAFQEIDLGAIFSSTAKWVGVIDDVDRIGEYVGRAFATASAGRPGPVILGLPEDMLASVGEKADKRPAPLVKSAPTASEIKQIAKALEAADQPLLIVGGPGWTGETSQKVQAFAERLNLPVAAAFRFQDYFDNRHQNYVGHVGIAINPKLAAHIRDSDLIIAMGPRLGEMTTSGYTLLNVPSSEQKLIHIHPGPEELGQVYCPEIAICASLAEFADRLDTIELSEDPGWSKWTETLRADYEAHVQPVETPGTLKMEQVISYLSEVLDEDAIVTNGAGNFTAWIHRYYRYRSYRTQLAPTSGSMGYGLPAAVAAKLKHPDRQVICFAGDGCFMMTSQELATAVHYGLPIVIIIVNNQMYGTIRMHQEKHFPERVIATTLTNPDFAAFARSFGAEGVQISETREFRPALQKALDAGKPTVIEMLVSPEALTPTQTLSEIRSQSLEPKFD